jgi:hypothetical protein
MMDIRGRCCPFINKKEFLKCGAMLDTAFFHFENDYDINKQLEATENSDYEKIIKAFLKKIGIKEWSLIIRFTDMFIEKYNEDNEITQVKDNIKELKDLLVKTRETTTATHFNNKGDNWLDDMEWLGENNTNKDFHNWYFNIKKVYREYDKKINKELIELITNTTNIKNEIKELYKKLNDKHTKFFQEKHFNKFQFRRGNIIKCRIMVNSVLNSYYITKVTKKYIEAYPIYYKGRCGDVRKFTKPSEFKHFVYDM